MDFDVAVPAVGRQLARGRMGHRGWVAGSLVVALVVSMLGQRPVVAAPADRTVPVPRDVAGVPVRDVRPDAASAWSAESRAVRGPRPVTWPAAGVATVDLSTLDRTGAAGRVRAGGLPVRVGRPVGDSGRAAVPAGLAAPARPGRVTVQVFDRTATALSGVDGLLLSASRADGRAGAATVAVAVDYAGFAGAFGADWATRLHVVRLPACAVSTPALPQCRTRNRLATVNNAVDRTVLADVPLSGDQVTVLAVEAGASGDNGDYTATSLSPAGTWQVSQQTGDFSWSYPLRMPPALGGPAPSLTLAYSAGSVDGRTATSNNQGSWLGDGWDVWPGFIERKYASCGDDNPNHKTGDLCWFSDNATLALNGHAGELIQSGSTWRLKNDDGTRVQRFAHADRANGDNDNEYWKVTTTDGMQYFFGYHRLPGWTSGRPVTNSAWTVPVHGNNVDEPCEDGAFANSWCAQAWRWNLDYVVDPHGNSLAYFYDVESGAYGRDNTPSQRTAYHRGGWLDRIEYGMRQGGEYAQAAPLRVLFATAERCLSGCWTGAAWTSDPIEPAWPDTPWDQHCDVAPCDEQLSPTFWSARRLAKVTAQVRNGASSYADVESWTLRQEFLNAGQGEGTPMWLRGITRTGHVTTAGGAAVSDPEITFDPGAEPLPNRVDGPSDGRTALSRWRIKQLTTESGGEILVTYSGPDCTRQTLPEAPETNTRRCMPAFYAPPWGGNPTLDWFHKYVVTRLDLDDLVTDQPNQTFFYDYLDPPAWHYNDDEITPSKYRTWGDWRGYGRVQVRTGDSTNSTQTAVEYRYLRGMNGDHLPSGTRSVSVSDSWGGSIVDHEALSGFMLQEITFNGPGGAEVASTLNEPWMVKSGSMRARVALAAGGFRTSKTATTYNGDGFPVAEDNLGDEATAGDETCTRTTYARNNSIWMIDKIAQVETLSVTCAAATTPAAPVTVLKRSRTFYDSYVDDGSFGAAPTKGDVVRTEELDTWSGSSPVYVATASNVHDAHGRMTATTDARGNSTTTAYTTANGGLVTQTVVTNPYGHQVTTLGVPAWGVALKITDANGAVTDLTYDGLGRLTQVWLPGRPKATWPTGPSLRYTYLVRNSGGPTAITTETLLQYGATTYKKTIALLDGWLRERQVQEQAPGGGRRLTDAFYNTLGQLDWQAAAYYDSTNAAPSATLGSPQGQIPAVTQHIYDGAGRETAALFKALGAERWRTTTGYGGDRVHTTPPAGGTATTAISDARGRDVELRQYKSFDDVGSNDPNRYLRTSYSYTLLDQVKGLTDQAGNTWSFEYDLRGRQTKAVDPDTGTTTSTYSATGQPVTITSPVGTGTATVAFTYDALDRKTSMRDDTVTGPVRAQWTYDTVANGKGKLASATRYSDGNAYTTRTDAYDIHGRPTSTSLVLPAAESNLCAAAAPNTCTYTTTAIYKVNSELSSTTVPAAADLPSEKLTYGYNDVGQPVGVFSPIQIYVDNTTYNKLGQAIQRVVGTVSLNKHIAVTYDYDEPTRRLTSANVVPIAKPEAVNYGYTYDDVGNLIKLSDVPSGQAADHQCYRYDHLRRLTETWTPASGDCVAAPAYAELGGPAPYWRQWTLDDTGNRLTEKRKASTGDTTFTSTYPVPGPDAVRPHAVTNITATGAVSWSRDYTYDTGGNTRTRSSSAGATQTLTFDREGRLATQVEGGNTTSYLYDADGNRLIRTDPGGSKTLYLPDGAEVRYDASTATTTATRYYRHGGPLVAVRTAAGVSWVVSDHHGTAELAIDAATLNVAKRSMLPYGEQRDGAAGAWPSGMDKGFVGGTIDPTGLTHLGAREYDPFLGRFISVDPIQDLADPQQWNGYAYSNSNPATFSDPSGLEHDSESGPCTVMAVGCKPSTDRDDQTGRHTPLIPGKVRAKPDPGGTQRQKTAARIPCGAYEANRIGCTFGVAVEVPQYCAGVAGYDPILSCIHDGAPSEGDPVQALIILGAFLIVLAGPAAIAEAGLLAADVGSGGAITAAGTGTLVTGGAAGARAGYNLLRHACSFGGDTPVLMADGTEKKISEVQPGDEVLATDPHTGEHGARTVTHVWLHEDQLIGLLIDGHTLITTEDHPFWNETDRQWQRADHLGQGEILHTPTDRPARVGGLRPDTAHIGQAYNLTVDGIHTYYVMAGDTPVLVHNTGDDDMVRVGRWMSQAEYDVMLRTGMVQPGGGGVTYVVHPASPDAFTPTRQGSVYAEFDVPRSSLIPGGRPGDYKIAEADTLMGRYWTKKGGTVGMPAAGNIKLGGGPTC